MKHIHRSLRNLSIRIVTYITFFVIHIDHNHQKKSSRIQLNTKKMNISVIQIQVLHAHANSFFVVFTPFLLDT